VIKRDLRKELKHLYSAPAARVVEVEVPALNFISLEGLGAPEGAGFQEAVTEVYSLAYSLKFLVKKGELAVDYPVMPLEGLWWTDDPGGFDLQRREEWRWRVMIAQPDFVTPELFREALDQVAAKKDLAALTGTRYAIFEEGLAAQVVHVGPFSEEGPTVARLHDYIRRADGRLRGRHHEIYLSDWRRTAPEKLRTILRQPFVRP